MATKLLNFTNRSTQALELKLQHVKMDWTSITHQTGYFDHLHVIKAFKKFSGTTPTQLLKEKFSFRRIFYHRIEAINKNVVFLLFLILVVM